MTGPGRSAAVVGAGAIGASAALELRRRGFAVDLLDPGPLPHPLASSTDISKAVRMDYGSDAFYAELAALALTGWRAWNREFDRPLFHETGILLLSKDGLDRGGFEADCHRTLTRRGVPLERLDRAALARRFPAWAAAPCADGYFNPRAGWVESGEVVRQLLERARAAGVRVRERVRCTRLCASGSRVTGVECADGERVRADTVVVAAGAWTRTILPDLAPFLRAVGQAVVHFRPRDARPFAGEVFPVWCLDIAGSGWYGFPANAAGVVKIGHHGPGRDVAPDEELAVRPAEVQRAVDFAARTLPDLRAAEVAATRLCLYCDTPDGDFLIDRDPARPGLLVAAGGSGHAFKFAPVLGPLVADVLEGRPNPHAARFAWRSVERRRFEQARHTG